MLNRIQIYGSSSAGNCLVLSFTNKKKIALDLGCKLDIKMVRELDYVLISHDLHSDHKNPLNLKIRKDDPPLKLKEVSHSKPNIPEELKEHIFKIEVPHKVPNWAYWINNYDEETILYLTDCGKWEDVEITNYPVSKLTYLFIEVNWDWWQVNQIKYKDAHTNYAISDIGHMSNIDALNFITKWKIPKECRILFLHKSQTNASFDKSYQLFNIIWQPWLVAKSNHTIYCNKNSWKEVQII